MQKEAQRGLEWYGQGKGGKGLVPATLRWARIMAKGGAMSPQKVRDMRAWLARHEVDKKGKGFKAGEKGYPSPGRVAWALWGGNGAVGWSNKVVKQMDAADKKAKESAGDPGVVDGVYDGFICESIPFYHTAIIVDEKFENYRTKFPRSWPSDVHAVTGHNTKRRGVWVIQSIRFRSAKWTIERARSWLRKNGYGDPEILPAREV